MRIQNIFINFKFQLEFILFILVTIKIINFSHKKIYIDFVMLCFQVVMIKKLFLCKRNFQLNTIDTNKRHSEKIKSSGHLVVEVWKVVRALRTPVVKSGVK